MFFSVLIINVHVTINIIRVLGLIFVLHTSIGFTAKTYMHVPSHLRTCVLSSSGVILVVGMERRGCDDGSVYIALHYSKIWAYGCLCVCMCVCVGKGYGSGLL